MYVFCDLIDHFSCSFTLQRSHKLKFYRMQQLVIKPSYSGLLEGCSTEPVDRIGTRPFNPDCFTFSSINFPEILFLSFIRGVKSLKVVLFTFLLG